MSGSRIARWRRAGAAGFVVLTAGLLSMPAAAAKQGKANDRRQRQSKTLTAGSDAYYELAGTSDPTNIPVVSSDLEAVAAVMPPEVQVFAPQSWARATGRGTVVAVLDGGFNLRHRAIAGNLAALAYDALTGEVVDDVTDLGNQYDDDHDGVADEAVGHGTFVAGMVLRVAPDARILPIRIRDDEGYGLDEWLVRGLQFAIAQHVDVINLSIESDAVWNGDLPRMLERASEAGIPVVISAGNNAKKQLPDMAWMAPAIIVGAVDRADRLAPFSNYTDKKPYAGGPRMMFAPGVDLYGPIGAPDDEADGWWSGTSFSAPLVSGAVALIRQTYPELLPSQIGDLLAASADPVYDTKGRLLKYVGRLNVAAAVSR